MKVVWQLRPRNPHGRYLSLFAGGLMANPLDDINWSRVCRRLTAFAKQRLGSRGTWVDAEDLSTTAISRLFDPDYKSWDPAVEPDLLRHLGSVVNGLISNLPRKTREVLLGDQPDEGASAQLLAAHQASGGAEWTEGKVLATEILERIATVVEPDKLASKVFWLQVEGVTDARDQATKLGRPIRDIYNARRRLDAKVAAAKDEMEKEVRDVQKV